MPLPSLRIETWGTHGGLFEGLAQALAFAAFFDVHGGVGLVDHVVEGVERMGLAADDADAHIQSRLVGEAAIAVFDVLGDAILNFECRGGIAGSENYEFIAANASHDIGVAEAFAEHLGGADDEPVARIVAQRVVDLLEAVEVDIDKPAVGVYALNELEHLLRLEEKAAAVVEAGQLVGERKANDLGLHLFAQDGFFTQSGVGGFQFFGALADALFQFLVDADIFHGYRGGIGECLENPELFGGRPVRGRPIVADGAYRALGADGHHGKAADEGGAIGLDGNARVEEDVGDGYRFSGVHYPATDAHFHGKPLAFPERGDRVFVDVITGVAIAQHKGCAVGSGQLAGRSADNGDDFVHAGSEGKALYDVDQVAGGLTGFHGLSQGSGSRFRGPGYLQTKRGAPFGSRVKPTHFATRDTCIDVTYHVFSRIPRGIAGGIGYFPGRKILAFIFGRDARVLCEIESLVLHPSRVVSSAVRGTKPPFGKDGVAGHEMRYQTTHSIHEKP